MFEPLNPVVPGHLLVIPKAHVANALENPKISIAVISVDPLDASGKSARIGRMVLERYLMQ